MAFLLYVGHQEHGKNTGTFITVRIVYTDFLSSYLELLVKSGTCMPYLYINRLRQLMLQALFNEPFRAKLYKTAF